jgi:hypothetical protein
MMSEVDRTMAFLDSLERSSNWVSLWDNEALLILLNEKLWGYALAGLAESCMKGGEALALPKSRFQTAASATKSSLLLSREMAAGERRQHLPRPETMQQERGADIIPNSGSIDGRELPGNRIFNAWKTPFKPRTVPSLPDSEKRLDRSALFRLAGGISETDSLPGTGAVGRMLRRNIRPTPLPQIDLPMQRRWLASLSGKAIGALGRIKPELLVLPDRSASAKPQRLKRRLIEDRLSPSSESERAPIDLPARFSEKHGPASVAGRDGLWPEIACQFSVSADKASQQDAGIFPASLLTSGEAQTFSASPGVALELGMLNNLTEKILQPANLSPAANAGNWPDTDSGASPVSTQKAGLLPAPLLPSEEAPAFSAASRKALESGMLNKSDDNETEYGNVQPEKTEDLPESLQPTALFQAMNDGNGKWPIAASSREESVFSAASKKALELSMLNNSDHNEAEYGNAQDETVGDIPENMLPADFSSVADEGNRPLAACKTSRPVFGMPLMPSLRKDEADAASSAAVSTRGETAKSLLSLQNRRETASEEDLEALAAKIKRILEEEARRHGIDV